MMKQQPYFIEFLLDQQSNLHLSTAKNKYNLIKRITEHSKCVDIFGSEYLVSFRKYLNPNSHNNEILPQVSLNSSNFLL